MSTDSSSIRVVVGLGNPGRKYEGTRHNVGFDVLGELSRRLAVEAPRKKFDAELAETRTLGVRLFLMAPQTFMNLSGRAVQQVVKFYQLLPEQLLVVCDDLNLPVGKLRLRKTGSAGGQKGLADILRQLSTEAVPRLRIGIGSPPSEMATPDFVLGAISRDERDAMNMAIQSAASAVELWARSGIEAAMNRFNVGEAGTGAKAGPKPDKAATGKRDSVGKSAAENRKSGGERSADEQAAARSKPPRESN